ncbi:IclR family transcriptional regulator C-terminal domain-containing protein [Microbacterium sp. SORGH_AS_0888]|uniref:IclR family transcriptional regulator domain-containing protein n=1 Tax=Microbacterium sp. SORGH_AS_0888 TaxID=3041791 RepID=UPI0027801DF0|nr:IclR family transcriptional regulator C-terminal domain-containing protein [Microbacterium sp. SORGH_AS_0888]MDQ1129695.1 IclR family pca regulon transcriptional regulator [Microbacterium sp. SORGH_AS_0888]
MVTADRSRDRVQSIERGMAVLRVFDGPERRLGASEIAARTGLPRPVVRRILLTFEHLGYVRSERGQWSLTARILELGSGYFAASSLPELAHPILLDIVAELHESTSVGVLEGTDIVHVARVDDGRPLGHTLRIGARLPAHATSLGRVLLAEKTDAEIAELYRGVPLERFTPRTAARLEELLAQVAEARESGYDVSIEEYNPGMLAAAVPISVEGTAIGALGVSSTTVREDERSLREVVVPRLRAGAAELARAYRDANPRPFRNR